MSTVDRSRVDIILGEAGVTNAQSLSDSSLLPARPGARTTRTVRAFMEAER